MDPENGLPAEEKGLVEPLVVKIGRKFLFRIRLASETWFFPVYGFGTCQAEAKNRILDRFGDQIAEWDGKYARETTPADPGQLQNA